MKYDPAMKVVRWVLGPAKDAVRYLGGSITKLYMGTIAKKQGDRRGFNVGAPAGCVAWPVQPDQHGGMSFIASDCFFAEYDARAKRVWMLDDANGKRHPGADPLTVGQNVTIHNGDKRSGKGVVIRSAEYGTAGLDKNIFIHADGDLIAHHRSPSPPDNSSMVHDPGEGPDDWAGGLHYPLRVRKFIRGFCELTSAAEPLFAPLLNFTTNGDGTIAQGAAHWGRGEGLLSDEAFGPLAPCDDGIRHRLGETGDARVYEAGLNITTMKLGDPSAGILYSPVEFDKTPRVPDGSGPWWMHTHFREDLKLKHGTICNGNQPGTKIWQTPSMFTEWGPPPEEPPPPPKLPPPGPPRNPETGEPRLRRTGDPETGDPGITVPRAAIAREDVRNKAPEDGSSTSGATPAELEAPSAYGHPAPTGPEPRQPGIAGATEREKYWLNRYGFTEREFAESPITSHTIHTAVHESATANDKVNGAERWSTVKSQDAIVYYDADGNVVARTQPAKGPGGTTFAAAGVEKQDLYIGITPAPGTDFDDFGVGVFASSQADGRFGMGHRLPKSAFFARGFDIALDFNTDADNPDTVWTPRDETGAAGTGQLTLAGVLETQKGRRRKQDSTGSNTTLAATYEVLLLTAGGLTINVPDPAAFDNYSWLVVNETSSASTLGHNGANINNAASDFTLPAHSATLVEWDPDGTGWMAYIAAADISGFGDFFADGSVAMTGTLDTNGNDIDLGGGDIIDAGAVGSAKHTITIASVNANALEVGQDSTTGPWQELLTIEATTSGTTPATIDYATATDTVYQVHVEVLAMRDDGTRHESFHQIAKFSNVAGTVTDDGDNIAPSVVSGYGYTAVLSASSTNIRLTLTGKVAETVRFRGFLKIIKCSKAA